MAAIQALFIGFLLVHDVAMQGLSPTFKGMLSNFFHTEFKEHPMPSYVHNVLLSHVLSAIMCLYGLGYLA